MTELVSQSASQLTDSQPRALEIQRIPSLTKISVILPIYNEASILEANVKKLRASLDSLGADFEILLCDDQSSDGTEIAAESLLSSSTRYFRFSKRLGKGGTTKNALRFSSGNVLAIIDADIPVSCDEIVEATRLLMSGQKLVVGVRRIRPYTSIRRKILSRAFNTAMNLLFRTGIEDHQCGFKIIDRQTAETLFPRIRSDHFVFDAELIANAKSLGIPVCAMEVDWLERREDGDSRISSPKVLLPMLIDMALLRLSLFCNGRLIPVRKVEMGRLTEINTGKSVTALMTVMDTGHPRLLAILRKLYLSIAYAG